MVVKTDVYSGFPAVAAVVDDSSRAVLEDCLSLLVRVLPLLGPPAFMLLHGF
jgi:hypothetical protein